MLAWGWLPCPAALAQGRVQTVASPSSTTLTSGWSFYISTEGAFESNPNFLAPPNDPSDFSGRAGGGFAFSHGGARGTFSLSGDGRSLFYRELTNLDTLTFGGSMAGAYRPGPKTDLSFNGSVSSDYTRRSEILLSQGIVLPQSQVLTMRFNAGISHTLSTRTTLSTTGRFERAQFDSQNLNDGNTFGATASLSRRVSRTLSLSAGYSHDQIDSDVQKRSIDTGYGGVHLVVNPRTDLNLSAGASSTGGDAGARKVTPYGAASINVKYPRLVLSLAYSHQIRQDYGVGRVSEADLATLNLNRTFGRRKVSLHSSLTYGLNRTSGSSAQDSSYRTYGATAGMQIPLARRLRADWGYSYFRTSQALLIDSHSAFVALSYRMELH